MCFLYGLIGAVIGKLFSSLQVLPILMISEEFPKSSPNNKVLGDRGRFPSLWALLAQSHWQFCELQQFLFYFSGVLEYQLLLNTRFVSIFQALIMVMWPRMGSLQGTGTALLVSGKSQSVTPCQKLKILSISSLSASSPSAFIANDLTALNGGGGGGNHLLPASHSGARMETGAPGLLSVLTGAPPKPHHNCLSSPRNMGAYKKQMWLRITW